MIHKKKAAEAEALSAQFRAGLQGLRSAALSMDTLRQRLRDESDEGDDFDPITDITELPAAVGAR